MGYDDLTKDEVIARLLREEEARRALEAERDAAAERERLLHELATHQAELEAQNQALREAQGQLEESRSRYADLYDFAPIPYFTFDWCGVVLDVNLTGATMLGVERSRVVGRPFLALARVDDPDAFARHLTRSLEAGGPITAQIALSTAGGPRELQLVSAAVRNPRGEPAACRTAFLDVTLRRIAERDALAAHDSEKSLRGRLERIDRASAAVSAALARHSGSDLGALLQVIADQARVVAGAEYAAIGIGGEGGRRFAPWVFSGMSPAQAATIGRTPRGSASSAPSSTRRPIRARDLREHGSFLGFPPHHPGMTSFLGVPILYQGQSRGNLYLANKQGADEFSEDDQVVVEQLAERVASAMEIARLRQLEAREHTRLEFLAKAGPLLAGSIDFETTLGAIARLVVPVVADLCTIDLIQEDGFLKKAAAFHPDPTKHLLLERLIGTRPPDRFPDGIRRAIETGEPQRRELSPDFLRDNVPDAEYREVLRDLGVASTVLAPLLIRGRVVGVLRLAMAESRRTYADDDLQIAREIAHHAALAIESARLYREARTAIGARDNLLAAVSHDVRNYLSTIRMGAELLSEDGANEPDRRRRVDAIRRAASHMERLIDGLRDATMIETGQFAVEAKPEDAAALVEEAAKTLEPQLEARALRLAKELEPGLPPVRADRERILQVVANLVANAIKFTHPGGEIRLGAKLDGAKVRFSVSDSGKGIGEHEIAHVFDRYWTGHEGTRNGTGLGLYIAKGIVEAHGGAIWVQSELDVGTTLCFTIPVAGPDRDRAAPSDRETKGGGRVHGTLT